MMMESMQVSLMEKMEKMRSLKTNEKQWESTSSVSKVIEGSSNPKVSSDCIKIASDVPLIESSPGRLAKLVILELKLKLNVVIAQKILQENWLRNMSLKHEV